MQSFLEITRIGSGARILDMGGHPDIWRHVTLRLNITVLNLPGKVKRTTDSNHCFTYVEGDACNIEQFQAGEFDLVFSNSVIEHVGPPERQGQFAREVIRLARSYWVQTPSMWFPIEAHCGMPFWWFYPDGVRRAVLRHWRTTLPAWSDSMAETRVLSRARVEALFPSAQIYSESLAGIPKSYAAYSVA